jgi:hypothetical protein
MPSLHSGLSDPQHDQYLERMMEIVAVTERTLPDDQTLSIVSDPSARRTIITSMCPQRISTSSRNSPHRACRWFIIR